MNETDNRAQTAFTSEHFVEFLKQLINQPYWYGTCIYKCTESLRSRKAKQYPSQYGSSRTSRYRQDIEAKRICADCIGAAKGYAWTGGGEGVIEAIGTDKSITSKYGSNGCPGKGASAMFAYAKSKGQTLGRDQHDPRDPRHCRYVLRARRLLHWQRRGRGVQRIQLWLRQDEAERQGLDALVHAAVYRLWRRRRCARPLRRTARHTLGSRL